MIANIANVARETLSGLDNLFTSDDEREQWNVVKDKISQNPELWNYTLNKLNSKSRSLFIAGWRPFGGWCLVSSIPITLCYNCIAKPVAAFYGHVLPDIEVGEYLGLACSMMGLSGLRTYEKLKNRTA